MRSGEWKGHTGKPIRNVVNIGIGGSDLGPVMAYEALRSYSQRDMTFRFVSNVDLTDFVEATRDLDAGGDAVHRLLEDVRHARDDDQRDLGARLGARRARRRGAVAKHFVAVSTNAEQVSRVRHRHRQHVRLLGLGRRPLLDGLGDRAVDDAGHRPGAASREMLGGFHAMDEHFRTAPFEQNLPVLMGLLAVWYGDFFGAQTFGGACPTSST